MWITVSIIQPRALNTIRSDVDFEPSISVFGVCFIFNAFWVWFIDATLACYVSRSVYGHRLILSLFIWKKQRYACDIVRPNECCCSVWIVHTSAALSKNVILSLFSIVFIWMQFKWLSYIYSAHCDAFTAPSFTVTRFNQYFLMIMLSKYVHSKVQRSKYWKNDCTNWTKSYLKLVSSVLAIHSNYTIIS